MTITTVIEYFKCYGHKFKINVKIPQAVDKEIRKLHGKNTVLSDLTGISCKWKIFPDGCLGIPVLTRTQTGKVEDKLSVEIDLAKMIRECSLDILCKIVEESDWDEHERMIFLDRCSNFALDVFDESLLKPKRGREVEP